MIIEITFFQGREYFSFNSAQESFQRSGWRAWYVCAKVGGTLKNQTHNPILRG